MSSRARREEKAAARTPPFHVADWPMHSLLAIVRGHVRSMGFVLQPFDCSPLAWRVLSIVCEHDQCSIGRLADISVIERSNLSRIVDGMERAGLVVKFDRRSDKRETLVSVTEKGRALFAKSLPRVLGYYARFLKGVSEEERRVFMSVLTKVEFNVCGPSRELPDG